jgi:hypothetical protein
LSIPYTFQLKCAVSSCRSDANPQNEKRGQMGNVEVALHLCDAHMLHLVALERKEQVGVLQQRTVAQGAKSEGEGQG